MERRNGPGKFSKLFYEDEMCENFSVHPQKEDEVILIKLKEDDCGCGRGI